MEKEENEGEWEGEKRKKGRKIEVWWVKKRKMGSKKNFILS